MKNKKWLSILVAFVASVAMWFYIVTVENPVKETTISDIPVTFVGLEQLQSEHDLIIVDSNVPNGVSLTFSGKISDLNKLQQDETSIMLQVDISRLTQPQERSLNFDIGDIVLPSSVSRQDFSLVSKSPDTVNIVLETVSRKTVPIKIEDNVKTEEGFIKGVLEQDITEITVEGPEDVVSQIYSAKAVLNRDDAVRQTLTATLDLLLVDADGNQIKDSAVMCSSTDVVVTLPVQMSKTVPLVLTFKDGGGATAQDVSYKLSVEEITISGDPADIENISDIKLQPIDLKDLNSNNTQMTRSVIMPENCTNVSRVNEVDVSITINNKAIRTINVSSTNFQKKALPAELDAKYNTTVLPVTIRADESIINQITEDNIRVIVDFTDMSTAPGNNISVPIQVSSILIDGVQGAAGVIDTGEYSVNLDIVSITG